MAINAVVVLDTLQCVSLTDSNGRAPYIWPILLYVDDATLAANPAAPVAMESPVAGEAHIVLATDMHAGDSATIPYPLGTFSVRFEDNFTTRIIALVIAVWEKHDFPDDAVVAGFNAFCSSLQTAVNANRLGLLNPATLQDTANNIIKPQVHDATQSAIQNQLGTLWFVDPFNHRDDFVDASFLQLPINDTNISLNVPDPASDKSDNYVINGAIQLLTPTVDLCQHEVDAVNNAQDTVDQINAQLQSLGTGTTSGQRLYILAQRRHLNDQLRSAQVKLNQAQNALRDCRKHWAQVEANLGGSRATTVTGSQQ